jgi:lipoate-protein ligase A
MKFIQWEDLDAYFNQAVEEYFLKNLSSDESIFMLWQNRKAIVVGKHQNTIEEINTTYVKEHDIQVVRRLSGGGTVYHDLGNLNYSLMANMDKIKQDIQFLTQPIVKALRMAGLDVYFSDRNDLLVDGRKISGSAQYIKGRRILHHGTLLFQSDLDAISRALKAGDDRIESRSIKSVRSRVTNIRDHLPALTIPVFKANLQRVLAQEAALQSYQLTQADRDAISNLRDERYSTWAWNYGRSPEYTLSKERRYTGGKLSIDLSVKKGLIQSLRIHGDSLNDGDMAGIPDSLQGVRLVADDIVAALAPLDISRSIHGLDAHELAELIAN